MTIRIDRVVTRGGDAGQTSLGDDARVEKDDARVEAYGAVDEANAALGLLRLHLAGDAEADAMVSRMQNDLLKSPATGRLTLPRIPSWWTRLPPPEYWM